jgi:rhodanese-related sulfurtransferase
MIAFSNSVNWFAQLRPMEPSAFKAVHWFSPPAESFMSLKTVALMAAMFATNALSAQDTKATYPLAKVSYDDFKGLVSEVEAHRANRLIDYDTFKTISQEPGVIILDSRTLERYNNIHLKGAKHLAFTDFTQGSLSTVIPSFDTKILIYCNNNFRGNSRDFATKVARLSTPTSAMSLEVMSQSKPLMMALNIPTYINLYGYGYKNVYELNELLNVNDPRVEFEGSMVATLDTPEQSSKITEALSKVQRSDDALIKLGGALQQ